MDAVNLFIINARFEGIGRDELCIVQAWTYAEAISVLEEEHSAMSQAQYRQEGPLIEMPERIPAVLKRSIR